MAKKRSRSKKRSKKYQIELTPLSIFLWGGCLFFVLAWIFVLGILAGRGFLPGAVTALSDLKNQIGVLQQKVSRERPPQDLGPPKKPDSEPKLAFYDNLSSKKVEPLKETAPPRNAKKRSRINSHAKRTNSSQQVSPTRESSSAQKATDQNRVGTSNVSRLAKKERREPSAPKAKYTVQLASLDEKNKAERFISDLVQRGYSAYFYEAKVKGKTYYRVRCGTFPNRKAAEDYARKLRKEAGMKGFVSRIE
jgi:cell division septation protein DedD